MNVFTSRAFTAPSVQDCRLCFIESIGRRRNNRRMQAFSDDPTSCYALEAVFVLAYQRSRNVLRERLTEHSAERDVQTRLPTPDAGIGSS